MRTGGKNQSLGAISSLHVLSDQSRPGYRSAAHPVITRVPIPFRSGKYSLPWRPPSFDIARWGSDKGISAQQQLMMQHDDAGWRLAQDAETSVQPRSDEKRSSAMCASSKAPRRSRNTGPCSIPMTRSSTPGALRRRRRSSSPLPRIRKLNSWGAIFIPCVVSAAPR